MFVPANLTSSLGPLAVEATRSAARTVDPRNLTNSSSPIGCREGFYGSLQGILIADYSPAYKSLTKVPSAWCFACAARLPTRPMIDSARLPGVMGPRRGSSDERPGASRRSTPPHIRGLCRRRLPSKLYGHLDMRPVTRTRSISARFALLSCPAETPPRQLSIKHLGRSDRPREALQQCIRAVMRFIQICGLLCCIMRGLKARVCTSWGPGL